MSLSTLNFTTPDNGNGYISEDASHHVKILLELANNAKKNNCFLRLISNVKEGDSMNNLLFEYGSSTEKCLGKNYVQMKITKNQEIFEIDDFELARYFILYQQARDSNGNDEFKNLIVLTNNILDVTQLEKGKNLFILRDESNDPIYFEKYIDINNGNDIAKLGQSYKLISSMTSSTEERNTTFEIIERSINLLHPSATSEEIEDFIDKLLLVTNLDLTKLEANHFGIDQDISEDSLLQFLEENRYIADPQKLLQISQKAEISMVSEKSFDESSKYVNYLKDRKLEFKFVSKNIHNFFIYKTVKFENRILAINTSRGETQFAVTKIIQAIETSENFENGERFLIVNTNIPADVFKEAITAFESEDSLKLLVIECDSMVKNYYKSENDLFDILQKNIDKKLIVIAEKYKLEIDPSYHTNPALKETEQKASDLTEISLKNLLQKTVRFQGTEIALGDMIEVENKSLIVKLPLKDLISIQEIGENISIYKKFDENLFVVRKFLRDGIKKDFSELLYSREKLIVISDVTGSGKSDLFNYMAKKLKLDFPSYWIIKFDFIDHCKDFMYAISMQLLQNENDVESAVEFLVERILKIGNIVEKAIFTECLNNPSKVILLFDGFDELPAEYSSAAINLLKSLCKTKIDKIFISTRPDIKVELEQQIVCETYKICPFSHQDQRDFWLKYCMQIKSKFDDLETFVNAKFEKVSASIYNFHEFASTPMITKMIAEYFEETYNPENEIQMYDVYKRLTDKKYKRFMIKSRCELSNVITKNYEKTLTEFLNEIHRILAFKQIFNEVQLKEIGFEKNPKLFGEEVTQILRCGLIQETKDGLKFVHSSFAQFFVVSYFLENLGKVNVAKFLISQIFVNPQYQMIRLFLNGKLKYKSEFYGRLIRNHFRGNTDTDIEESVLIVTIKERLFENFYFFYDAMFENMNSICFDSKKTMDLQSNLLQHMICYTDNIKQFLDHVKSKFGLYFVKKIVRYRFERNLYQIKMLLSQMDQNEIVNGDELPESLVKADINYSKFLKWIKHNINGPFFVEEIIFSNRMKGWDGILSLLAKFCFWNSFWVYIEELDFVRKAYNRKYSKHIKSLLTYENPNSDKTLNWNVIEYITNDISNGEKYTSLINVALEEDEIKLSNIYSK